MDKLKADGIGTLVGYWDSGLRYGYIEKQTDATVTVKPIGPKGTSPHCITVSRGNIEWLEQKPIVAAVMETSDNTKEVAPASVKVMRKKLLGRQPKHPKASR